MNGREAHRLTACTGKVRHASYRKAAEILELDLRRGDKSGNRGRMNCYRYQFCKGYHIGHREKTP